MYIKRLEIDNFKSFANKTEINFQKGFTAIAGINGSGKSTIIDSILFALGLSSARALRSENGLGDLISTHNNRQEAMVKVVLDLEDDIGSEVSFARRIRKTSQGYDSVFFHNDKPVTKFHNISELEKYSITSNSYNIIMQGDVLSLVACSAVDKRKYIDEIAGTADFDRKIEAATGELKAVEDRVRESNLVLDALNSRVEELKEQREVALKYQELRQEKDNFESQITSVKYFDFKRQLEFLHENILKAQSDKKKQELEFEKKKGEIEAKQAEFDEICAKVKAQGEDKQLEVKRLVEEKKGEINRKKDSIINSEKLINTNNTSIYNSENAIKEFLEKNEKARVLIQEKEALKAELEKAYAAKQIERDSILSEMTGLSDTANTYIEKRNALRKQLDDLKEDEQTILREKHPLEVKFETLTKELNDTNEAVEGLNKRVASFDENKDKLASQVDILTKELDEVKTTMKVILADIDKTKNQLQDDARSINLANNKVMQLEAEKRVSRRYGSGAAADSVIQAGFEGVHNTLAQLVEFDSEYTDAMNEAFGARSNNIVVDNENVATRVVEYLKTTGKGRVTCLPLNRLRPAPNNLALPKAPGVIDFAINLLDFDDKYLDAFYLAVGDTLIVDNMQSAKKLMGKYRIITLDGEIFDKAGSITGGAKREKVAAFGKANDKELETFKKRLYELEEAYRAKENKRDELENMMEKLRDKHSNAMTSLQSAKYEYSQLLKSNEQFESIIEEKLARINQIVPEIKKTEGLLDKFEQKYSEVLEKMTTIGEEVAEVEKFIDQGELKKLQEATDGVEKELKELEKKIFNTENEIARTNDTVILFNEQMIEQKKADITRLSNENIDLNEKKQQFGIDLEELNKVLITLEEKVEELGKNLVELQNLRQNVQNELIESEKAKNILENEIERIKTSIESFKATRADVEPQLESLINELKEKGIKTSDLVPTEISIDEINSKIQKLQKKIDDLGLVNMRAIEDYNTVLNQQNELNVKIVTLEKEMKEIEIRMQGYEDLKKQTFLETFDSVNKHFQEIFTELTDGVGRLILENPENPFLGGLTIEGSQKNKDKQKLVGMSGGEKTLVALSLVFAFQRHAPAPFYALDEVDSALDGFNVERIGEMISKISKQKDDMQVIAISQRSQMHGFSKRIIGVTQNKGRTMISGITNQ